MIFHPHTLTCFHQPRKALCDKLAQPVYDYRRPESAFMSMNIIQNQLMSDRIVLDVGPTGEKGIKFYPGEILKGVVQDVKPGGIISILIKGDLIDVTSEEKISRGQHMYLLVDSVKNGQVHLRMITVQGAVQPDDNNLAAILRSLDVPFNADTALITGRLLQQNLPVTQQNIIEILKAANLTGGITTRNLEAAVFALEHNIPLDKNTLPLVNQFISSNGDLSRLLRELGHLLARVDAMARSASLVSAASSAAILSGSSNPTAAAVQNLTGAGGETVFIPVTASETSGNSGIFADNSAGVIPQGASQQSSVVSIPVSMVSQTAATGGNAGVPVPVVMPGTDAASGVSGSVNNPPVAPNQAQAATNNPSTASNPAPASTGETGSTATTVSDTTQNNQAPATVTYTGSPQAGNAVWKPLASQNPVAPDSAAAQELKSFDLAEFVKVLRAILDSSVGRITGSGADVNPVLQSMIRDRALLLDNLRGLLEMVKTSEVLTKTSTGQELLGKISSLQQQIAGQSLFNSAVKLNQDAFTNNYYFSFPVEINKQLTYCQLRMQKNVNSRLDQQDNIKLVVSLDTPALGIIMFHIDWHRQGYIQLQGVVETDEARSFIEKNIADLLFNLGELGYTTGNSGVKVAGEPEEFTLKPFIKEEEQGKVGTFSIDIMA